MQLTQIEFFKGNWALAETLQVYCPIAYKTTTGRIEIYPMACNPDNADEAIWIYSDPEETMIMQGSWSGMFEIFAGQGYELQQDEEYRTLRASVIIERKRGDHEQQRRKGSA